MKKDLIVIEFTQAQVDSLQKALDEKTTPAVFKWETVTHDGKFIDVDIYVDNES